MGRGELADRQVYACPFSAPRPWGCIGDEKITGLTELLLELSSVALSVPQRRVEVTNRPKLDTFHRDEKISVAPYLSGYERPLLP